MLERIKSLFFPNQQGDAWGVSGNTEVQPGDGQEENDNIVKDAQDDQWDIIIRELCGLSDDPDRDLEREKRFIGKVRQGTTNINMCGWPRSCNTLLMEAAKNGRLEIVQYLVEKRGADVTIRNPYKATALDMVAANGSFEVVQFLTQPNFLHAKHSSDYPSINALLIVAAHGYLNIVEYLLQNQIFKVDALDQSDPMGRTALMAAALSKTLSAVRFLVEEYQADVNKTDSMGETALSYAMAYGGFAVAQYLIGKGADVNVKFFDTTALGFIVRQGDYYDIACLLIRSGASLEDVSRQLVWAAQNNKQDFFQKLSDTSLTSIDLSIMKDGKTLDEIAQECGHHQLATYIQSLQSLQAQQLGLTIDTVTTSFLPVEIVDLLTAFTVYYPHPPNHPQVINTTDLPSPFLTNQFKNNAL